MMNLRAIGSVFLVASLLIACTNKVYVEKPGTADLANYKTYTWVKVQPNASQNKDTAVTYLEMSIRDEVNNKLRNEGWKLVKQNPDVLVSFDVMAERSVVSKVDPVFLQSYNPGYINPYSMTWAGIYYPANFIGWDRNINTVTTATAVVTMTDGHSNQELWQGWTNIHVGSDGIQTSELENAVKEILEKFNT
ncbi:MAG TPA: DUF4136 domain-containing protein [Flavisolibacter sp.]|nr:DUF4136 domain-containing protein [Flavisolibacter sp.]